MTMVPETSAMAVLVLLPLNARLKWRTITADARHDMDGA